MLPASFWFCGHCLLGELGDVSAKKLSQVNPAGINRLGYCAIEKLSNK
ncbi:MAG: hypothetical protein ANABAC_3114 [Anaerolineae bacterium]|nr:MAG: hypothetical protein ANABAC_3114 [Anaerolineae bacterium]